VLFNHCESGLEKRMAKRDRHNQQDVTQPSNISTGEDRIDPSAEPDTVTNEERFDSSTNEVTNQASGTPQPEPVTPPAPIPQPDDGSAADEPVEDESEDETDESEEDGDDDEVSEVEVTRYPERTRARGLAGAKRKQSYATAAKPVLLGPFELTVLEAILGVIADGSWDAPVAYGDVSKEHRPMLRNLNSRGLIDLETDEDDGGRIISVKLTYKGVASITEGKVKGERKMAASRKAVSADEAEVIQKAAKTTSGGNRGRRTPYDDPNFRIMIMVENNPHAPGSRMHEAFKLYWNGMTYREYMASEFDANIELKTAKTFVGPHTAFITRDTERGYIAWYDATKPQEDPDYWVTKNRIRDVAPAPRVVEDKMTGAKSTTTVKRSAITMTASQLAETLRNNKAKLEAEAQAKAELEAEVAAELEAEGQSETVAEEKPAPIA
jgi:hypothetical protein